MKTQIVVFSSVCSAMVTSAIWIVSLAGLTTLDVPSALRVFSVILLIVVFVIGAIVSICWISSAKDATISKEG